LTESASDLKKQFRQFPKDHFWWTWPNPEQLKKISTSWN